MPGYANLMHGLADNFHRLKAMSYHRGTFQLAAGAFDQYALTGFNFSLFRQFMAHFDKHLGLQFQVPGYGPGYGLPVLGETIGRTDNRKSWIGCGRKINPFCVSQQRISALRTHKIFGNRAFKWFIMFRKRSICESRAKNLTEAMGPHNKRIPAVAIIRAIRVLQRHAAAVDHIPNPFAIDIFAVLDLSVKFHNPAPGIPGLPLEIHRGPIVNNPPVQRPGPGKFRITADIIGGVVLLPPLGLIAFFCITVAVEPVATGGTTVIL